MLIDCKIYVRIFSYLMIRSGSRAGVMRKIGWRRAALGTRCWCVMVRNLRASTSGAVARLDMARISQVLGLHNSNQLDQTALFLHEKATFFGGEQMNATSKRHICARVVGVVDP